MLCHRGLGRGAAIALSDPALEAALIARLLYDPDQIPLLRLAPDDFAIPDWGRVYGAMLAITSEHKTVDVPLLAARCPGVDLTQLLEQITPAHRASVIEYAEVLRDMAERRRLAWSLERVRQRLDDSDIQTAISDLSASVSKALAGAGDSRLVSPDQAAEQFATRPIGGLPWTPERLNQLLQPARGGEMVVVAARPSVGKTVVCEMLVEHWAQASGRPVLFASLEMGVSKLMERHRKRSGESGSPKGVWYLDDPRATTATLRSAAARVALSGPLGAIAVDYIGLLKDRGDNENQRIGRISSELKALAREHDVPLLALSQLNRSSARRDDPVPRLDDIRDSGAVEQDADICLGLHRDIGSQWMTVKVLKNRDGQAGQHALIWFDEERVSLG